MNLDPARCFAETFPTEISPPSDHPSLGAQEDA